MLVGVVNAAKVVNLRHDAVLRESLLECDMLLADGQSVVWAGRILGRPLPERVAGIDLFEALLELADREGRSIYLLGARPEVLATLTSIIRAPVAGGRHGRGRGDGYFTDDEAAEVAEEIREAAPDMLFLGITSPKKEIFLGRYGDTLGVPVLHGVGGSFDVLAGVVQRAPARWQRAGLEWAYRLLQEPGRLWRRYLGPTPHSSAWSLLDLLRPTPAYTPNGRSPMDEIFSGRVAVIGLGYIGLPTAVVLATRGVDVVGVDVNPACGRGRRARRGALRRARPGRRGQRRRRHGPAQGRHRDRRRPTRTSSRCRRRSTTTTRPTSATSGRPWRRSLRSCGGGEVVILESTSPPGHDAC